MDSINLMIGQTISIELEDECFTGKLRSIDEKRTRLVLENVIDMNTKEEMIGVQCFYKSEILSIEILEAAATDSSCSPADPDSSESAVDTDEKESDRVPELTLLELEQIREQIRNAIYISKTDRAYCLALYDIRSQYELVINLEDAGNENCDRAPILTIATENKVYIFDLLLLGRIYADLKNVLEMKTPRKICFGQRTIENLQRDYNTTVNQAFDCFLGQLAVGRNQPNISLNDSIFFYFNPPEEFLVDETGVDWNMRPFDADRKCITAKKTIFILKIFQKLLHEKILTDLYKAIQKFSLSMCKNNDLPQLAYDIAVGRFDVAAQKLNEKDLAIRLHLDNLNCKKHLNK